MKGVGMLVVSLRGVNFGFWSHLGCSGRNAIIFSREGLVYGSPRTTMKIYILSVFNMVSFRFNSKFLTSIPTPFMSPPPGDAYKELSVTT